MPGLSENPSVVGLLRVKEQQVQIATKTVQYRKAVPQEGSTAPTGFNAGIAAEGRSTSHVPQFVEKFAGQTRQERCKNAAENIHS